MKLNPICRKDMLVSSRSISLPLVLSGFNAALSILVLMNLFSISESAQATGAIAYAGFLKMYYVLAGIELLLIVLITPALTVSAISGERERQTLELLLTTQLKASQIVNGKMMSALSITGLLAASSMPVLATVFIYGGVTVREILILFAGYAVCACFSAAVGICTSSFLRSTAAATASAYILILFAGGACYLLYQSRVYLDGTEGVLWTCMGSMAVMTVLMLWLSQRHITPRRPGGLYRAVHVDSAGKEAPKQQEML